VVTARKRAEANQDAPVTIQGLEGAATTMRPPHRG
jgi:hypothetical protein